MSSEVVSSPLDDADLERRGYEIAKMLFSRMEIPSEEEEEEEEEEGITLTRTNLRNMLEAARDAEKKGSWDIFKLKVIYLARRARREDPLYQFVRRLLTELTNTEPDQARRIRLAEKTLIASIYMFNALRKGFHDIVIGR